MPPVTVTLSSVGTSRAVNLDWVNGAPTSVAVTGSSSGSFAYTIQQTLDDLQLTDASAVSWVNDPNATALTANSSVIFIYYQALAGIRLSASTVSSATLVMKVNQGKW
jgi:hypothetical protein